MSLVIPLARNAVNLASRIQDGALIPGLMPLLMPRWNKRSPGMAENLIEVPEGPFDPGYKGPDWDDERWDREPDPPDPTPPVGPADGITLYRALARHHIGDPCKEEVILNAVLEHFIRVLLDDKHVLHQCYLELNKTKCRIRTQEYTFFGLLACPDFGLCPCQKNKSLSSDGRNNEKVHQPFEDSSPILVVIANALNACIALWDSKRLPLGQYGPVTVPMYHVMFRADTRGKCLHRCSALSNADDGAALIDYIVQQRGEKNGLQIKRLSWKGVKPAKGDSNQSFFKEAETSTEFDCFNEYRTVSLPDVLPSKTGIDQRLFRTALRPQI